MTEDDHLDLDILADYAEGLLDEEGRGQEVQSHLGQCPECHARANELVNVTRRLAAEPSPQLPAHVAEGIDEALSAAEQERTVVPMTRKGSHARWGRPLRLGGAAASVALVLVGGVFGIRALDGAGSAGSAGYGAGSSDQVSSLAREGSGRSSSVRPQAQPQAPATAQVAAAVTVSGKDYSSKRLAGQVSQLLKGETGGSGVRVQAAKPVPAPLRSLAAPSRMARCVAQVTGGTSANLLTVDLASYSGKPSAVIVATGTDQAAGRAARADAEVWVVDPSCSQVRAHTEVARKPG